jgi:hypothetical protein
MRLIQIGVVLALGLFTTWLANLWLGLFDFIYDLRQARSLRATSEMTEREQ